MLKRCVCVKEVLKRCRKAAKHHETITSHDMDMGVSCIELVWTPQVDSHYTASTAGKKVTFYIIKL